MKRVTRRPHTLSILAIAVCAAVSHTAFAEEVTEFENVVVWGTKVSSSSESLVAEDMSLKQADHMSDLLRDIPGVDVGGTHSVNQSINIRSLRETDLDIRLDGASQHANMFHHVGNLTLNPDILKSADVQVGNNSVLQSGLGGSVLFETKDAQDLLRVGEKFGARVYGGYASNASQQGSMTAYGMLSDNVDALIYGNWVDRDNFEDGNGKEVVGVAGDTYNVLAKVGYGLSDIHRFELSFDTYRDKGNYSPRPDMNGSANDYFTKGLLTPTTYDRTTITGSYELDAELHRGKVVVFVSETELKRDESTLVAAGGPFLARAGVITGTNTNSGANAFFYSDLPIGSLDNELAYGVDYVKRKSKNHNAFDNSGNEENTASTAVFVEDTLFVLNNLSLTAGLRYDTFDRESETGSKDFDDVTWSLGTSWQATEAWEVFANARSLFKAPDLLDTFVFSQGNTKLADDIKPETGINKQAGLRFASSLQEHRFSGDLTIFNTLIEDYITSEYDQAYNATYVNSGDVEIKGFELSFGYAYQGLATKLSYASSRTRHKESNEPVTYNGRSIDVGDSVNFTADYYLDNYGLLLGWNSQFVYEETNVAAGAEPKPSYSVHNIYAQWVPQSHDQLTVTFGIDNLLDEAYYSHASRSGQARGQSTDDLEPGRNIKLSAAYQF